MTFIEYSKKKCTWDPNQCWFGKCGSHLRISGCLVASSVADTLIGTLAALGTLLSAGVVKWPRERMSCHLKEGSQALLADPFSHCLMIMQPHKPINDRT